jgi:hypothetical protein
MSALRSRLSARSMLPLLSFLFRRDLSEVVAVTWLLVALAGTVLFGGFLGLRGLFWLGLHDALCLVGVSYEFRQMWQRAQLRLATAPGRRITP